MNDVYREAFAGIVAAGARDRRRRPDAAVAAASRSPSSRSATPARRRSARPGRCRSARRSPPAGACSSPACSATRAGARVDTATQTREIVARVGQTLGQAGLAWARRPRGADLRDRAAASRPACSASWRGCVPTGCPPAPSCSRRSSSPTPPSRSWSPPRGAPAVVSAARRARRRAGGVGGGASPRPRPAAPPAQRYATASPAIAPVPMAASCRPEAAADVDLGAAWLLVRRARARRGRPSIAPSITIPIARSATGARRWRASTRPRAGSAPRCRRDRGDDRAAAAVPARTPFERAAVAALARAPRSRSRARRPRGLAGAPRRLSRRAVRRCRVRSRASACGAPARSPTRGRRCRARIAAPGVARRVPALEHVVELARDAAARRRRGGDRPRGRAGSAGADREPRPRRDRASQSAGAGAARAGGADGDAARRLGGRGDRGRARAAPPAPTIRARVERCDARSRRCCSSDAAPRPTRWRIGALSRAPARRPARRARRGARACSRASSSAIAASTAAGSAIARRCRSTSGRRRCGRWCSSPASTPRCAPGPVPTRRCWRVPARRDDAARGAGGRGRPDRDRLGARRCRGGDRRQPGRASRDGAAARPRRGARAGPGGRRPASRCRSLPTREIAAELWLRTYRYDDARRDARAVLEAQPQRISPLVVLARASARVQDTGRGRRGVAARPRSARAPPTPTTRSALEAQRALAGSP